MKFETKVRRYANELASFSANRNDRSKNIIMVANQYENICRTWCDIVPDILLNKMLDSDKPVDECIAMNSLLDCVSAERVVGNVEHLIELYEKTHDEKKLTFMLLKAGKNA